MHCHVLDAAAQQQDGVSIAYIRRRGAAFAQQSSEVMQGIGRALRFDRAIPVMLGEGVVF